MEYVCGVTAAVLACFFSLQDVLRDLAPVETELDELDGLGHLLCKNCMHSDGEVVQQRLSDLR